MYYDMSVFTAYYKDKELVKLIEGMGEEGYLSENAVYFKDAKVFIETHNGSFMDDPYTESRTYIENDEPFAGFGKEKDPEDEKTKLASQKENPLTKEKMNRGKEGYKKALTTSMERFSKAK